MGFRPAAPWDEDGKRVLEILGVPRDKVVSISAENVFDTIGEARAVAPVLKERGLRQLVVVTSKYHTRRAGHIWRNRTAEGFQVTTAPARHDPFDLGGVVALRTPDPLGARRMRRLAVLLLARSLGALWRGLSQLVPL
jgi:uncharacterized SAM-binding protein YcdF (DUF218 family)